MLTTLLEGSSAFLNSLLLGSVKDECGNEGAVLGRAASAISSAPALEGLGGLGLVVLSRGWLNGLRAEE